jgi:hypothetical protein
MFAYASPNATLSVRHVRKIQSSCLGMIPTAIYFKSSDGIRSQMLLVHVQYLEFDRRLDGSLRMEFLIVLLNPLLAVYPLVRISTTHFSIYHFYKIFFPLVGDQPVAAAHVTEDLHAAFELFQVRSGEGVKPLHTSMNGLTPAGSREAVGIEVLRQTTDLCRGEKGAED